jgi:choline kinase
MSLPELIILAAGRGTRMKALTSGRPKCLTPLLGLTLLDWQLAAAKAAGIDRPRLIGGYAREKLPAALLAYVNPRWAETNMVATLFQASELLSARPCLVAYSDIVYRPEHLTALWDTAGACAVLYDLAWESLWRLRNEDFLADAESFSSSRGRLLTISEKGVPLSEIEGQYMGLLKFTPAAWTGIDAVYRALPPERRDKIDMTSFLRLLLAEGLVIEAKPVSGGWVEVDTETDLEVYEAAIARAESEGRTWLHDWRFQ